MSKQHEREELEDNIYIVDTVLVCELRDYMTKVCGVIPTTLNSSKTKLSSSVPYISRINNNVKTKDGINPNRSVQDKSSEFVSERFFCEHCEAYYEGYCYKCGWLVHILNRHFSDYTHIVGEEIPNHILEMRNLIGEIGIFALKVIPEGIRFGPFTGLSCAAGSCSWKIKDGKFIVNEDKIRTMNWMQHIRPAKNVCEQNLLVFQYEDNLYYRSTREIQVGEELLVYFGEQYEDSLKENLEMDFVPIKEESTEDVFACIFCCLGFSSKIYLEQHKKICPSKMNVHCTSKSMIKLTQCTFCKIYFEEKEYLEHHIAYCRERNAKKLVLDNRKANVNNDKRRRRPHIYKCTKCTYKTKYKREIKNHTNEHFQVKVHRCGRCYRRFKTKGALKLHAKNINCGGEGSKEIEAANRSEADHSSRNETRRFKCSACKFTTRYKYLLRKHTRMQHTKRFNYNCATCKFKTTNKRRLLTHAKRKHLKECQSCGFKTNDAVSFKRHIETKHVKEFIYGCDSCPYTTNMQSMLDCHVRTKHLNEFTYKCKLCPYKTNYRTNYTNHIKRMHVKEYSFKCDYCQYQTNEKCTFEMHVKTIHLQVFKYKCESCVYKTNYKTNFEKHVRTKHLQEFKYVCKCCDFKTNEKRSLTLHASTKHLMEFTYECDQCDYKTNRKTSFKNHTKTKHLIQFDYNCPSCTYKTNRKTHMEGHIKVVHLKEFDYNCPSCPYKTNRKPEMDNHINSKHLNVFNFECEMCDFKTNRKLNLECHRKNRHFKEYKYKCTSCEFKTNQKARLVCHVKEKHS